MLRHRGNFNSTFTLYWRRTFKQFIPTSVLKLQNKFMSYHGKRFSSNWPFVSLWEQTNKQNLKFQSANASSLAFTQRSSEQRVTTRRVSSYGNSKISNFEIIKQTKLFHSSLFSWARRRGSKDKFLANTRIFQVRSPLNLILNVNLVHRK